MPYQARGSDWLWARDNYVFQNGHKPNSLESTQHLWASGQGGFPAPLDTFHPIVDPAHHPANEATAKLLRAVYRKETPPTVQEVMEDASHLRTRLLAEEMFYSDNPGKSKQEYLDEIYDFYPGRNNAFGCSVTNFHQESVKGSKTSEGRFPQTGMDLPLGNSPLPRLPETPTPASRRTTMQSVGRAESEGRILTAEDVKKQKEFRDAITRKREEDLNGLLHNVGLGDSQKELRGDEDDEDDENGSPTRRYRPL